jgi:hypothetical protein
MGGNVGAWGSVSAVGAALWGGRSTNDKVGVTGTYCNPAPRVALALALALTLALALASPGPSPGPSPDPNPSRDQKFRGGWQRERNGDPERASGGFYSKKTALQTASGSGKIAQKSPSEKSERAKKALFLLFFRPTFATTKNTHTCIVGFLLVGVRKEGRNPPSLRCE